MALVSLSVAVSGDVQASCETLTESVHAEVTLGGVRYAATAGGLLIDDPSVGTPQVKSACDGLAGTYLQAIARDPRGALTLAIRGQGVWSFDPMDGGHERLLDDPRLQWPTALVWQGSHLWIGTVQDGLWRVDLSGRRPALSQPIWRFRKHRVTGLAIAPDGRLLVGRDLGGLWGVDDAGRSKRLLTGSVQGVEVLASQVVVDRGATRCQLAGRRRCLRIREATPVAARTGQLPSAHITSLVAHPDPSGTPRLWVGTFDQGVAFRGPDGQWHRVKARGEAPRLVNTLASDGQRLWVASATGAYVLEGGRWRRFGEQSGLPSDHVNALHLAGDEVWFATSQGVARFNGSHLRAWGVDEGLPYRIIYSIAVHGDRVLAGTAFGLGVFEGERWGHRRMGRSGLSDDWVNAVAFRADGVPLLGTYDAGVDQMRAEAITPVPGLDKVWVNPSGLVPVPALGGVFVATLGDGLWFWPDAGEARRLRPKEGLPSQDVTSVLLFEGSLFVGTRNGLARWTLGEDSVHLTW
uniref:Uncharacterized protein n=1 Tax=uncultured bacterium HF186_25m_18N5 TaxID=662887 RepID=C7FPD8_9BACT|nr:hypothetical protein [uncultured bacterium HF186_25m_18N5]